MITYEVYSADHYDFHEELYAGGVLLDALKEFNNQVNNNSSDEVHLYVRKDDAPLELIFSVNNNNTQDY